MCVLFVTYNQAVTGYISDSPQHMNVNIYRTLGMCVAVSYLSHNQVVTGL